ncbi:hypothetical protein D3C78_489340 [compost metagenome]
MGIDHLLDQLDVARIADLHQHNRQIARNRLAPETGLITPVAGQQGTVGPQGGVGVNQRGGHLLEQSRIGQRSVELTQQHLAMGPGQVEDPIGQMTVAVLGNLLQAGFTAAGYAGDQVDGRRLSRLQADTTTDRDDRVENRTGAATELYMLWCQGRRGDQGTAPADEPGAIGFIGNGINVDTMGCQQMTHPRRGLLLRTRAAAAHDRLQRG